MDDPKTGVEHLRRASNHALMDSRAYSISCYASKNACKCLILEKNLMHSYERISQPTPGIDSRPGPRGARTPQE